MGLDGARAVGVLSSLATSIDKVDEAQEIANKSFAEGVSVTEEYNVVNNNLQAQLEKAREAMKNKRLELGEKLYPVLLHITKASTGFINTLGNLITFTANNKAFVLSLVGAWVTYTIAVNKATVATVLKAAKTKAINVILSTGKIIYLATAAAYNAIAGNATRAAAAQQLLKASFASTPWGAILTAVTALAVGIYAFATRTTEAEKALKRFNEESAKSEAEARFLFDALAKATVGSNEYKDILQKLKELYPEIINGMINEQGELQNVDKAYRLVISSIREKIALQIKEQAVQDAYAKDINERNEQASDIFRKLSSQKIPETIQKAFMKDLEDMIKAGETNLTKIQAELGEKYKNINFSAGGMGFAPIWKDMLKMIESSKELNKDLKEIELTMGTIVETNDPIKELNDQIKSLQLQLSFAKTDGEKKNLQEQINLLKQKIELQKQSKTQQPNTEQSTGEKVQTTTASPAGDGGKAGEKLLKEKEKFYQKIEQLREKDLLAQMSSYQKEKYEIEKHYDELIKEAKKYKDEKLATELEDKKQTAVEEVTTKHLEKYQKLINEIAEKQAKMQGEGETNSLLSAIAGSQKKWQEHIAEIEKTITLLKQLKQQASDPVEISSYDSMISDLETTKGKAETQEQSETTNVIKAKLKEISDTLLSEKEKQIQEIKDRYEKEIEIAKAAAEQLKEINAEQNASQIEQAEELIEQLNEKMEEELEKMEGDDGTKSFFQMIFGITDEEMDNMEANWQTVCDKVTDKLHSVASTITDFVKTMDQIQTNAENKELKDFKKLQDDKLKALKKQYDSGIISLDAYNTQKEKIETETDAKEKQLQKEQFRRQKTMSIIQATIDGIAGAVKSFNSLPAPYGFIPMAISIAITAAQIAAIASQPEPFAKGGYIDNEKIIRAGEKGKEWIASHSLLQNKETAPIIAALEDYQKGNKLPFNALQFSTPTASITDDRELLSAVYPSGNSSQINNIYLEEINQGIANLTQYLSDPKNRQTTINRQVMSDFNEEENTLRNLANI
jgi:hypothetical protein